METILFMIIIGVISTIFGKAKANQGKNGSKPFSVNNMKDVRTLFDELTNNKPRETFSVDTKIKTEKKGPIQSLEKEYEQVRHESEASRARMAAARKKTEIEKGTAAKIPHYEETEPLHLENADSNSLVNGLIWSEILAEPRAKRPYSLKK